MASLRVRPPGPLRGEVTVPGDKSITHRALLLGALADGTTEIADPLDGADCRATVRAVAALGIAVEAEPGTPLWRVHGKGLGGLSEPIDVLDCGNSGTTMRLLAGVLAGQAFFGVLTGDASLRQRPMRRVLDPLVRMGAEAWGRQGGAYPPIAIRGGALSGTDAVLPVASAQVKSAILLAGLWARGAVAVTEPALSRDHTERMLEAFGVPLERRGTTVRLMPGAALRAQRIRVPGDISSAAFFIVAALVTPGSDVTIRHVGINPTRTGILDALSAMGADITVTPRGEAEGGEPVGDLHVRAGRLRGTTIGGALIPRLIDEVPVLTLAAACAEGMTRITDAAELRVKEVDRIAALAGELGRLGARVREMPDGLTIEGGEPLTGAPCRSRGDHRMAMVLAAAGLAASGETLVQDTECIETSFPGFAERLAALAPGAARPEP
jgi:3-phosphoshikimate 1-carboxyvinyltransferase